MRGGATRHDATMDGTCDQNCARCEDREIDNLPPGESQLMQQGKRKTWLQGIHTNPDADFSRQNSRKAKTVASEGKLSGKDSV
jgi:hypothetical protein